MRIEPFTHRVLEGPLEPVLVYEAPVRLWHWITVASIAVLATTGWLIGAPPPSTHGEAVFSFTFGWIRTIHFVAAFVLIAAFVFRLYWAFVGNAHAAGIFAPPLWRGEFLRGVGSQAAYYLFIRRESERWVGHNPLALTAMFTLFTLAMVVIIFTGLGLYAQGYGWGSAWMNAFGWVTALLGTPQAVRTVHHSAMWVLLVFALVHIYMVIREDIMSQGSVVSTMVNGLRLWKRGPSQR